MDCFQPVPKPDLSETIIDTAAKHFRIENEDERRNLKLFFDFYTSVKIKENIVKAFQKPECANN